jgi:mono/diheme cytochrome c family protein
MVSKSPAAWIARILLFAVVSWSGCGQDPERQARQDSEQFLAEVDTVFSELGGLATASLDRGQRWRMVSSMGSGLPPPNFNLADLPEPEARGAALLAAYCIQCHWLPAPQMHAAQEWPILMRRMVMRAQTLHDRMGGPMTRGILGQYLLSGMASAQVPSVEDIDSLVVYLQRNAMPVAEPEELGTGPEREFFVRRCGFCHETPSPQAHTAEEWPAVVGRMHSNMAMMSVRPLSDEEAKRVVSYLRERAPAARP